MLEVIRSLFANVAPEGLFVGRAVACQVIHTDMEPRTGRQRKQPLDGLGPDFNVLEGLLL